MRLRTFLAALTLLALPLASQAAQVLGPISNCSGTIGTTAANIVFPSSGTGGSGPADYLLIQNNSTASQIIWLNVFGGVATTAPPSIQLTPGSSITYTSTTYPMPTAISIIGSAIGAVYTCHYK